MDRARAVDRIIELVDTVDRDLMPVPIREIWVFGDVALGLDPVSRIDIYLTKDLLFAADTTGKEPAPSNASTPRREVDRTETNLDSLGIKGVGKTVSAQWVDRFPEHLRTNDNGYAAPKKCLSAHLVRSDEPIHLEVCNASFEDNVAQRLLGARSRDRYEEILDPRAVCLWIDGQRSPTAFEKLRTGGYPFPPLVDALQMLGMDGEEAENAAATLRQWRTRQDGATVRGDLV